MHSSSSSTSSNVPPAETENYEMKEEKDDDFSSVGSSASRRFSVVSHVSHAPTEDITSKLMLKFFEMQSELQKAALETTVETTIKTVLEREVPGMVEKMWMQLEEVKRKRKREELEASEKRQRPVNIEQSEEERGRRLRAMQGCLSQVLTSMAAAAVEKGLVFGKDGLDRQSFEGWWENFAGCDPSEADWLQFHKGF